MADTEKNEKVVSGEFQEINSDDLNNEPEAINSANNSGDNREAIKIITSSGHSHHHSSRGGKRSKRHRRKNKKVLKRVLIIIGILLLLAAAIAACSFAVLYNSGKNELKHDAVKIEAPEKVESVDDGKYVYYKGGKYKFNPDIMNLLFIGIDENNGNETDGIGNNGQSDVLAIAAINSEKSKVTIINIPRDIMTDVKVFSPSGGYSGTEKMQIALSFAYGDGGDTSCVNTMAAVRSLFYNIPISSYFALKMEGVPELNDSIGGVDVKSTETIRIFEKGEKYHLEGSDALLFVRARDMYTVDANLKRNLRQRVYLNAFIKKFVNKTKGDIGVPISVFNATKPFSFTNLNANKITYLATEFILNKDMKIEMKSIPVTVEKKGENAANYVKEDEFYEMFLDTFYDKVDK